MKIMGKKHISFKLYRKVVLGSAGLLPERAYDFLVNMLLPVG